MSLIEEMRPRLEALEQRRWGTRTYDPNYVLDTHLQLPNMEEARAGGHYKSLNRPKVKPVIVQPNGDRVYQTSHGELNTDAREKFSNAWQWTTTNQATYKGWIPVIKPPDYGSRVFLPHADMVGISIRPLRFDLEANEWQELYAVGGLLPEDKVWPKTEQIAFPHNAYPGHRLTRTRYDARERSQEEMNKLKEQIRDLVKSDNLNPQFIRPFIHFGGHEAKEARTYEPLERPPTLNPAWMQSVTHTIHRPLPQKEYNMPEYAMRTPFARMITPISPNNSFRNERKSEKIWKI